MDDFHENPKTQSSKGKRWIREDGSGLSSDVIVFTLFRPLVIDVKAFLRRGYYKARRESDCRPGN